MEEKLGAILSNPQLMQQIMSMAQAMSPPPEPQGLLRWPRSETGRLCDPILYIVYYLTFSRAGHSGGAPVPRAAAGRRGPTGA